MDRVKKLKDGVEKVSTQEKTAVTRLKESVRDINQKRKEQTVQSPRY